MQKNYPATMSQKQRRQRRKNMARLVRRGKTLAQVAAFFGVSEVTVRNAINEQYTDR